MHARRRKNTFQRRREHRFYRSFHRDRKRDPMHQLSTFLLDSTKQRSETKKKTVETDSSFFDGNAKYCD